MITTTETFLSVILVGDWAVLCPTLGSLSEKGQELRVLWVPVVTAHYTTPWTDDEV